MTKPSIRAILIFSVGLLIVPVSILSQGRSTVTGYVFGPDRKPIDRARVDLSDGMGSAPLRVETDGSGRFVFTNVASRGLLQVRVIVPGSDYGEELVQVEVGSGASRSNDTVQVDVHMRSRKRTVSTNGGVVVFSQEVPDEARKHYQAAIVELDSKRTAGGMEQLQRAITLFPTYFAALERLGVESMKGKMYDEARRAFTAAVAANSRSFNGWYGLAYANFATERFADAIDAAGKAALLDKNAAEVFFVLGLSQRRLKTYQDAEKSFVRAKELDKGQTPDIHWNLALLYAHNLQKYAKAADELELFLKATPDNPEAASIRKLIANFRSKHAESK